MSLPYALPIVTVGVSSATDTTLVAAQPGKRIRVWQAYLQNKHATTDTDITVKSGSTAISGVTTLKAVCVSPMTLPFTGSAWWTTAAGQALVLNTSAAGNVCGQVHISIED